MAKIHNEDVSASLLNIGNSVAKSLSCYGLKADTD